MATDLVEPRDPNTPVTPEVEPTEPQDTAVENQIPDEVLRLPAMQALIAGSPPAVSAKLSDFANRPEAKLMAENKDALLAAGMGFYKSLSGDLGVVFNSLHIHPSDLQAADKAGKLLDIAPPVDQVDAAVSKSGTGNPVLQATGVPGGPAMARSATIPPQSGSGGLSGAPTKAPAPMTLPAGGGHQGTPASLQRNLMQARVKNIQPGTPTSGASPGAGRLLNQILKPVV